MEISEKLTSKYKLKFFNFFLMQFLNRMGGYNLDHDENVYLLANFGAKIRSGYLSFTFGVVQENVETLMQMLNSYNMFDITQIQKNIIMIHLPLEESRINKLKSTRSKNESQKKLKQLILNCYRKVRDDMPK